MELRRIDRLISKSANFEDLFEELKNNKSFVSKFVGDVFERLTQAYLLTLPQYSSILKEVWLYDDIPRKLLKDLNLPTKDFGIDLLAKTKQGEYWTIQSKFRSTTDALTFDDLSTFSSLSFVTAKNIKLGLIAHTTNKPIRNRMFLGNITEIGLGRWLSLTEVEWKNIQKFCNRKPIIHIKRKPRPHQEKAITLSKKHFIQDKNSRGKLIMPCATGKSLAAFWITQAMAAKEILVAVPSLSLIRQSLDDWTKEFMAWDLVPEWLCICSDESVGKVDTDEFNSEVYDLGIPTTTNKDEIIKFLNKKSKNPKIIFTTYQSSPVLAESSRDAKHTFDFAILDEAHKTVGVASKTFSTLLFDKNISIKKRLFMTATERVFRGKKEEVVSMNNPEIYGDDIFVMTFKDAIEQDIISDYKILTLAISSSEVDRLIGENRFLRDEKISDEIKAQYLAAAIGLKKSFKKHKIKHAISFHRSIAQAKSFQKLQDDLNEVKTLGPKIHNLHISSKISSNERVQLIKEFREYDRSLLTNARCLTEGVDIPAVDCVTFVDPKQSTVDIVQASGRALRKFPGKEYGYIILPIIVPEGMSLLDFSETTAFKKIISIISALSAQDERIAEQFRLIENGQSPSGKIVNIDIDIKLSKKININEFSSFVNTKTWEKVARINFRDFQEAKSYAQSLGLKNARQWETFAKTDKKPPDIPANPRSVYQHKGWKDYGEWLGTGAIATHLQEFMTFKEAKTYAQSLGLKNQKEWREFAKSGKKPPDIPAVPERVYKHEGWTGYGDWLGTGYTHGKFRDYKSFEEARAYVHSLRLKNIHAWREFAKSDKKPPDIPKGPERRYKHEGWTGYGDWLGTGNIASFMIEYRSFHEARAYAQSLGLKSDKEWKELVKSGKKPIDIPAKPDHQYKNQGWVSMGDWLDTGTIATQLRKYKPFDEARAYAQNLGLKNQKEWIAFSKTDKKPPDIPASPNQVYKLDGWIGMRDWLGNNKN